MSTRRSRRDRHGHVDGRAASARAIAARRRPGRAAPRRRRATSTSPARSPGRAHAGHRDVPAGLGGRPLRRQRGGAAEVLGRGREARRRVRRRRVAGRSARASRRAGAPTRAVAPRLRRRAGGSRPAASRAMRARRPASSRSRSRPRTLRRLPDAARRVRRRRPSCRDRDGAARASHARCARGCSDRAGRTAGRRRPVRSPRAICSIVYRVQARIGGHDASTRVDRSAARPFGVAGDAQRRVCAARASTRSTCRSRRRTPTSFWRWPTRLALAGASVTAPLKPAAVRAGGAADDLSRAHRRGQHAAARRRAAGTARNFDVAGFSRRSIDAASVCAGVRAVVLGAGGAARAAVWALTIAGRARRRSRARRPSAADALARRARRRRRSRGRRAPAGICS